MDSNDENKYEKNYNNVFSINNFNMHIAALSAADANATNNNIQNGTLTLSDLTFKIPEGFTAVENDQDNSHPGDAEHMDGNAVDTEVSADYRNNNGEKLDIHVGSKTNSKIETINLPNAQKKTIAGKDGYYWTEMDDGRTEYNFEYLQDGKIVKIETHNEDVINQVIS